MDKHICKQCGKLFNYCRACVFKSIPWKEAGFCSRECSAEFKIKEVIPVEDVEVIVTNEDTSTSEEEVVEYPQFFTVTEEPSISKKKRRKKTDDSAKENDINDNEQSDS